MKVNGDDTINADIITIKDLELLNNIIENNNLLLVTTYAKNLLEAIEFYKTF